MADKNLAAPAKEPFAGGGEMGALMRATDWSRTRLGPVEGWPHSLKTMLGVVLGSRFPMLLWWGPDLLHLYNDAYRPILRDKHPASLAAPAAEVWAEVWDVAGPLARSVQEGGPATWTEDLQLFINSGTMAEETYFTFSYSPVPGDDGRVGGLLNTVQETTAKVQGERQIRMLHDLAARVGEAKSEAEAFRLAAEVLSANALDLPFVSLYALGDRADRALLVGAGGWGDYAGPAKPAQVPIDDPNGHASWPLGEAIRSHREVVVDDLGSRFGRLPLGRWNARAERAIVLPLSRAGQARPTAFLIAGVSPHRALDEGYLRFLRATADQLTNAVGNAHAYQVETNRAEALAELDRAKTAFFSNVSHEFRTPLTLMLGPLEDGVADTTEPLSPRQKARLELVHDNALRLLKLVNALLDFSRLEAGRLKANYAPLELAGFTAELAGMFQSATDSAGLRLLIDCPPTSERAWVDRDMWEKIVPNLVSNALKFTLAGQITVRLRGQEKQFVLEVADTGTGIPEAELPRIFERFYRVAGSSGRTHEGTGIGLALVRELVELHAGRVSVESSLGRGTTFRVELPKGFAHLPREAVSHTPADPHVSRDSLAHAAEAARWASPRAVAGAPPGPVASPATGPPRAHVLVVDDNADLRAYVAGLLSPSYEVSTAPDGLAALLAVRERPPDIVVSDVMMPRLDGLALVRELRGSAATASLPVILLSARAGEEAAIGGLDAGSDDYLVKPFSARELVARVRTHLELARARRAFTEELERANRELDAFSYAVSHDLRAPLRAVDGFASLLAEGQAAQLDARAKAQLDRIREGVRTMTALIDALLELSRIGRAAMRDEDVDLSALAREALAELEAAHPGRELVATVAEGLSARGDRPLLYVVLTNLIGNAWKYTSKVAAPRIEVGRHAADQPTFFVRDNGAGFDMKYVERLFAPFQRLHLPSEFEGTGIGLATVQRILARHGGRIWAEAAVGQGATFFFSLPGAERR